MKKRIIPFLLLVSILMFGLSSCGEVEKIDEKPKEVEESNSDLGKIKSSTYTLLYNELNSYLVDHDYSEEVSKCINDFYESEKQLIKNTFDLEEASNLYNNVIWDINEFKRSFTNALYEDLENNVKPEIDDINNINLRASATLYYYREFNNLKHYSSFDTIVKGYKSIKNIIDSYDTFHNEEPMMEVEIINYDSLYDDLYKKLPTSKTKTKFENYYNGVRDNYISYLKNEVTDIMRECRTEEDSKNYSWYNFFKDLNDKAIEYSLEYYNDELDLLFNEYNDLLSLDESKEKLKYNYNLQLQYFDVINNLDDISNVYNEIKDNLKSNTLDLLKEEANTYFDKIIEGFTKTPYDYLPKSLFPYDKDNALSQTESYNDTRPFDVDTIVKKGMSTNLFDVIKDINYFIDYMEYFDMTNEIIKECKDKFNEATINLDNITVINYSGTDYSTTIRYDINKLELDIKLSDEKKIKINYDIKNDKITYQFSYDKKFDLGIIITNDSYFIGMQEYSEMPNSTTEIDKKIEFKNNNGVLTGSCVTVTFNHNVIDYYRIYDFEISELFLTMTSSFANCSYFENEIYDVKNGNLIAFERIEGSEKRLWLNLYDINNLPLIRITDKTDDNDSELSSNNIYLYEYDLENNIFNTKLFSPTYISDERQYDIEFVTKYCFIYDEEDDAYYSDRLFIPMLFIREEALDLFNIYMLDDNSLDASISVNEEALEKILSMSKETPSVSFIKINSVI